MNESGVEKKQGSRQGRRGFRLIRLLILVAIIATLAAISIPNFPDNRCHRSVACRVARDTKTAVTQAMVYANDKGVYPTSIRVLAVEGYMAAIPDKDPWGNDYVLSPVLTQGSEPKEGDNIYVYSKGPKGTGVYPRPFASDTGEDGSIGYSSQHAFWGPPRVQALSRY